MKSSNKAFNSENYSEFIEAIVHLITNCLFSAVVSKIKIVDFEFNDFRTVIEYIARFKPDASLWISPKKHVQFQEIRSAGVDALQTFFEEEFENEAYSLEDKNDFILLLMACHFEADVKSVIQEIQSDCVKDIIFELSKNFADSSLLEPDQEALFKFIKTLANNY